MFVHVIIIVHLLNGGQVYATADYQGLVRSRSATALSKQIPGCETLARDLYKQVEQLYTKPLNVERVDYSCKQLGNV